MARQTRATSRSSGENGSRVAPRPVIRWVTKLVLKFKLYLFYERLLAAALMALFKSLERKIWTFKSSLPGPKHSRDSLHLIVQTIKILLGLSVYELVFSNCDWEVEICCGVYLVLGNNFQVYSGAQGERMS